MPGPDVGQLEKQIKELQKRVAELENFVKGIEDNAQYKSRAEMRRGRKIVKGTG